MDDIFQEDSDYGASSYDDASGRAGGRSSQISLKKDYIVTDIAEHPDFDPERLLNDISVLKLQKPIELAKSDRVNAACMPGCQNMFDNTFNNGTGVRCWVAGEGSFKISLTKIRFVISRGVAKGRGREFGRSVNPIQTRGADYAPHTTASPPGFKKLSTPLFLNV